MEETDRDKEQAVNDFLKRMTDFCEKISKRCPYCEARVNYMRKTGRCVYLYPCGCRLWQGQIPDKWKGQEVSMVTMGENT